MPITYEQTEDIRELVADGIRPSAVAAAFGVTPRRVYQILHEERATPAEVEEALEAASRLERVREKRSAKNRLLDQIFDGAPEFDLNAR